MPLYCVNTNEVSATRGLQTSMREERVFVSVLVALVATAAAAAAASVALPDTSTSYAPTTSTYSTSFAATDGSATTLHYDAGCTIHLIEDLPEKEPLILQKKCNNDSCGWRLPEGDENYLFFKTGEEILVSCTRRSNTSLCANTVIGICSNKGDSVFKVGDKEYSVKDFICNRTSEGLIVNTHKQCGPGNAVLLELGFVVLKQWYPIIKVCHVTSLSGTLYSEHTLQGETTKRRRFKRRPFFEEGGNFYQGFSPSEAYKNANKTFEAITGRSDFPSQKIHRGHLSPDADFLLTSYRYATYFYVNTVPMWGNVNSRNWASLEEKVRNFAKARGVDLQIATGAYQIMELTNREGKAQEFFLYSTPTTRQIPLPRFIWKVVYHEEEEQGIAFVVINDPFKKTVESSDVLCPNICKETGWHNNRWMSITRGYLYCCDVNQLQNLVSYVPKYQVKSILRGPG